MLPTSTHRVSRHTPEYINQEFRNQVMRNISHFVDKEPSEINRRIEELDREWDIERVLEANAAALALTGVALGAFVNRR